jgi:hypothetical protein
VGVAFDGHYAYVAAQYVGLQVIDMSNPANPRWVGSYDTPGEARAVAVAGNYAYVADGPWGLQILRVHLPPRFEPPIRLTPEGFEAWLQIPDTGDYRIEVSSDLCTREPLMTLPNRTGRVRILDRGSINASHRFYRVVAIEL